MSMESLHRPAAEIFVAAQSCILGSMSSTEDERVRDGRLNRLREFLGVAIQCSVARVQPCRCPLMAHIPDGPPCWLARIPCCSIRFIVTTAAGLVVPPVDREPRPGSRTCVEGS